MAELTLNNEYSVSGAVLFTNVPNIVTVFDETGGTNTEITISLLNDLSQITSASSQWNITILGESIGSVLEYSEAVNKNFLVASTTTSTAASIARALRNCGNLYSTFGIQSNGSTVTLKARTIGSNLPSNWFSTNIPSYYMSISGTNGSAYSQLDNALIDIEVQDGNGDIVTTLEKTLIDGEAKFNISPILTSMAEKEKAIPINMYVTAYKDGNTTIVGSIEGNHTSIGYLCNQGEKYLLRNASIIIAQNVSRGDGTNGDYLNAMPLYVYENSVPLSFYVADNVGGTTIKTTYLDSAYNFISSASTTWRNTDSSEKLKFYGVDFSQRDFPQAYYVDITIGNTTLRYTVIKPRNMASESTRVKWINEYGGISFFDFTGNKSETKNIEQDTYRRNIFDFYSQAINELELTYKNKVEYEVTVTSHLLNESGTYIFNSLAASPYVWTSVNGQDYAILVNTIDVNETDQDGVYKVTVKYKYSQQPQDI